MNKWIFICSLVWLVSCKGGLAPEAYIKYVEGADYPYKITKTIGDKKFTMIYTPNEYLVVKSLYEKGEMNPDVFEHEMKDKENFIHFIFIIEGDKNNEMVTNQSTNQMEFNDNLMYMMNDLQFDFTMKSGSKTYPCVFANYERNFGLTNKNNTQVIFDKVSFENDIKIIYNDRFFNIGPVVFDFKKIKNKKLRL